MSETTPVYPVDPPNPAAKPGVGGLAAIPGLIGSIVGADDFCSVWNFPLSAVCVANPDDPERHGIPAWCLFMPDGHLCPGTEPVKNEETGLNWSNNHCFDSQWKSIPCLTKSTTKCYDNRFGGAPPEEYPAFAPCNNFVSCMSFDGVMVDCDKGRGQVLIKAPSGNYWPTVFTQDGQCVYENSKLVYGATGFKLYQCYVDFLAKPSEPTTNYQFDPYMRLVDYKTGIPITNDDYEGGYPMNAVYPPPPPEPQPEPFDPGPNPFNPSLPVVPDGEKCAGIVCECIALVVNAIGALNNTVLKVDETLLGIVDQLDDIYAKQPNWFEKLPLELLPILNKLGDILDAIDDISIDIAKEAESNIWDFLGDTIKELGDLVQFIIDKIIYLVVPEDTDFLRENFSMLREAMSTKFEPVAMLKTQIQMSLMTEQKNFKDIEMTLPIYGRVEFLNVEFLNYAVPKIRALISGIMIIVTSVWAYRKITSDMVR